MVSKTPIGPANCKPHVVGCCPKLSVYPPHRLPTSSAIASIPLGSRESSREEGVERHHMEAHTIQCYFFYFAAIFRATSQQPSKQCLEHCCEVVLGSYRIVASYAAVSAPREGRTGTRSAWRRGVSVPKKPFPHIPQGPQRSRPPQGHPP